MKKPSTIHELEIRDQKRYVLNKVRGVGLSTLTAMAMVKAAQDVSDRHIVLLSERYVFKNNYIPLIIGILTEREVEFTYNNGIIKLENNSTISSSNSYLGGMPNCFYYQDYGFGDVIEQATKPMDIRELMK